MLSILTLYLYQKARYKEVKKQKNKERRLETFAYVDSLTKIPNRRYFDETFIKEWESCLKEQNIICVILIDVDFFKNYNDSYGHQLGDECLASIASALRMSVNRSGDLIARYGGEEFVAVLPNTSLEGVNKVTNLFKENVKRLKIYHKDSKVSDFVTVSIGAALMIPREDISSLDFLKKADNALYRSKEKGRDKITIDYFK